MYKFTNYGILIREQQFVRTHLSISNYSGIETIETPEREMICKTKKITIFRTGFLAWPLRNKVKHFTIEANITVVIGRKTALGSVGVFTSGKDLNAVLYIFYKLTHHYQSLSPVGYQKCIFWVSFAQHLKKARETKQAGGIK